MTNVEPSIAVLILTLNEGTTLPISLGSVRRHCGDVTVLVLDSLSSDNTVEAAQSMGARVATRRFNGYATQRRHGLDLLRDYDWVLMLDADEEITASFAKEMLHFISTAREDIEMALFRRKDFYLGKWARRSSGYPTWFGRLVRPGRVRIEREINEEYHCDGQVAYLKEHLHHYPYAKGLSHWLEKHGRYAEAEARLLVDQSAKGIHLNELLSENKSNRRRVLKSIFMCLPFRPLAAFIYLYIIRMGFLDGRAGFQLCTMRFIYESLINLKRQEILHETGIGNK